MGVEVVVAPAELRSPLGENRFVIVRLLERRLIGSRPEFAAGHVAEVTEVPQLSQVLSSRQRVTAMSFQRL